MKELNVLYFLSILLVFAVYRVTFLLVAESGPFDIFGKLRQLVGVRVETRQRLNVVNQPVEYEVAVADNIIGEIFTCFYCCSLWVSIIPAIMMSYIWSSSTEIHPLIWFIVYWFYLSGGAILVKEQT